MAIIEAARSADPDVTLLTPSDDCDEPEVSIVVPALNEELTVSDFVAWCHEGLERAGVAGEILIIDSSDDRTAEIAVAAGARVLKTPRRGLGRAYIDAVPYIRGQYVVMGDADCTYDFRELRAFVTELRAGNEFAMGSRWRGSIEPGSMPALHRYLGTPVTTWILNRVFSSHFSDIHCGMRGITREALERMDIESQSWEYASEMVIKSVKMKLRTAEVPVRFLRDPDGRVSHHKRAGWFSPWQAAWINLRAMFVHGADFFVLKPGLLLLALGLLLTLPLTFGPLAVGGVTLSLYTMLVGVTAAIVGLHSFFLGCIHQTLHDYTGQARRRWLRLFPYNRTVAIAAATFAVGVGLVVPLIVTFIHAHLTLPPDVQPADHMAVTGMLFLIAGFTLFTSTLLLHSVARRNERP